MEKNNIFDGAYFGKPYRTRDGRKAIYTMMSCDSHWLAIQDTSFTWEYNDNGELVSNIDNAMDIVAEWQEEINEEELDKLAWDLALPKYIDEFGTRTYNWVNGFEVGYRKAKEE